MAGETRRKMLRDSAWRRISPVYCEKSQVERARWSKHWGRERGRKESKRKQENGTGGREEEWYGLVE